MKLRTKRKTLIAIGLLGGILLGVRAPARADDDSLLETVREAFGKPRAEFAPPVLIFPFMDDDRELTDDSSEWANIVTLAMVYGPQRRMSISVPYVKAILAVTNLVKPGTRVTNDGARQCTAALGEPCYVLPITRESDQGWELELEFHGNGRAFQTRHFAIALPETRYGRRSSDRSQRFSSTSAIGCRTTSAICCRFRNSRPLPRIRNT